VTPRRVRLESAGNHVEIAPDEGGRLASLVVAGEERLVTAPPADQANPELRWGCYVMAPWVGRVRNARFGWNGRAVRLAANFGAHAIHGLVTDRAWRVLGTTPAEASLACVPEDAPWPFTGLQVVHEVALGPDHLALQIRLAAGAAAMPAAVGWHPWFRRPDAGDIVLTVDAAAHLVVDGEQVPTGATALVDGTTDLRAPAALGDRRLDHTYLRPRPPAVLSWPDLRLSAEFGHTVAAVQVNTPPEGVCVEPQTAWPDAVNLHGLDTGLVTLQPGEQLIATTTWRWSATA